MHFSGRCSVGDVSIDWGNFQLSRPGAAIKLTPKAAAVLQLLLAQPGVTIARREILDAVWPGTASSDEVLTTVINELRRALGDSGKDARCIATVPKLGYRWVGAQAVVEPPVANAAVESTLIAPTFTAPTLSMPSKTATRADLHGARLLIAAGILAAVLVTLIGLRWLRSAAPEPNLVAATPPSATATLLHYRSMPITSEAGLDLDPDLDRSGRRVVYTHSGVARVTLRMRTLGSTEFTDLPTGAEGQPSAPVWSPEGTHIAYIWQGDEGCELRILNLADQRTRTIANDCPKVIASSLDWSPDGQYLVYSRYDAEGGALASRNIAVFRIGIDGRDLQRLSHSRRWLTVDGHPRISADGKTLAFVRDGDERNRVVLVTMDETHTEREVPTAFWPYRVEWLNGASLLIAGHGTRPAGIWRVAINGARAEQLPVESAGPGLTVSGDGRIALVEQRRVNDNIWSVDLGNPVSVPTLATEETRSEICPRIAPDGRTLAYLSDENGALEISLRDLASGAHRRISSFAPYSPLDLRWSPRGTHLAVVLGTDSGKHLAVISIEGERLAVADAIAQLPIAQVEWSLDQRTLFAVVTRQGRRELAHLPFPKLDRSELIVDFSVANIAAAVDDAQLLFTRPEGNSLQRLSADGTISTISDVVMTPAPSDQWLLRDGWLVQMRQIERSTAATVIAQPLAGSQQQRSWRIAAPEPPLGRNIDLGAGRLWYSSRDLDEADLLQIDPRGNLQ